MASKFINASALTITCFFIVTSRERERERERESLAAARFSQKKRWFQLASPPFPSLLSTRRLYGLCSALLSEGFFPQLFWHEENLDEILALLKEVPEWAPFKGLGFCLGLLRRSFQHVSSRSAAKSAGAISGVLLLQELFAHLVPRYYLALSSEMLRVLAVHLFAVNGLQGSVLDAPPTKGWGQSKHQHADQKGKHSARAETYQQQDLPPMTGIIQPVQWQEHFGCM